MPSNSPLLLLLDGVLSQDEERVTEALSRMQEAGIQCLPKDEPMQYLSSIPSLERLVSCLMRERPEWAHLTSQRDRSLPLHFAASIGVTSIAKMILEANYVAASTPNQKGKTPLHYAAREGRTEMVQYLVSSVPKTASIQSNKDKLALHFAAGEGHLDVVRILIKAYPAGVSLASKKGKVALHFAARWGNVEIAKELLKANPDCIKVADFEGSLAFHDAAREGQLDMMKFLVRHFPRGLAHENLRGETPLFPAVRSGNLELVDMIIRAWPESGKHVLQRVRDHDKISQWNPKIVQSCLRGAVNILEFKANFAFHPADEPGLEHAEDDAAIIASVLSSMKKTDELGMSESSSEGSDAQCSRRNPEAELRNIPRSKSPILEPDAKTRPRKRARMGEQDGLSELFQISDHRSFLELHAALECGASAPVLEFVLDRYGQSQIDTQDELGRLPLHVAMASLSGCPDKASVVDVILEKIWRPNPDACFQRDFLGRLPLHHALMSRADSKLVEALLETNPSSGMEYCDVLDARYIDKLPIEMARECGCDLSTIFILLRSDPTFLTTLSEEE